MPQRELALARGGRFRFAGCPGVVLQWAKGRRETTPRVRKREIMPVPSSCSLARLVMADPEVLPKTERSLVLHLLDQVPPLADTIIVAKRLNTLLRREGSESLSAAPDVAVHFNATPSGVRPAMDHEPRAGTGEPPENAEAGHVWPCWVPAPACPPPLRRMTEQQHEKCGRTQCQTQHLAKRRQTF